MGFCGTFNDYAKILLNNDERVKYVIVSDLIGFMHNYTFNGNNDLGMETVNR